MNPQWADLLHALREPAVVVRWQPGQWNAVLRQAKCVGLLGRLGALVVQHGLQAAVPLRAWHAMHAPLLLSQEQQRGVAWELFHFSRSLAGLPGPVVLLKGAAYAALGAAPAAGRVFSDMDVLVPREQLDQAEHSLRFAGWISTQHDAYDQRYYRQWMHELPPLSHMQRGTSLDVHHRLLPLTARLQTPPEPVLAAARPLPGHPFIKVPQPLDMILHSACHLFHEGEWAHGLRDVVDLDALLRAELAAQGPALWPALQARATTLNLARPLHYALRCTRRLLHTPVPDAALLPGAPSPWVGAFMEQLLLRAMSGAHRDTASAGARPAEWLLYLRSHYLRMPLRLLVPHLVAKAWRGWQTRRKEAAERAAQRVTDKA